MKKSFFLSFLCLLFFVRCSNRPNYRTVQGSARCENGVQDPDEYGVDCGWSCLNSCPDLRTLEGEIFRRYPLDARFNYLITGPLIIRDQGELVIQPGMNIKVQPNVGAYIAVVQGGSLFAYGNENSPITISSNAPEPQPGDWGGIILCGKAPIGQQTPQLSPLGYYFYGGDTPDDSSGYLRYLKIEHAGGPYDEDLNFNALSLYGVGDYTQIQNLWINESLHHGLYVDGGTFSMDEVVVTHSGANGAVFASEWTGSWDGLYIHHSNYTGLSYPMLPSLTATSTLRRTAIVAADQKGIADLSYLSLQQFEQLYIAQTPLGIAFNNFSQLMPDHSPLSLRFQSVENYSNEGEFNTWYENNPPPSFPSADTLPTWVNRWDN